MHHARGSAETEGAHDMPNPWRAFRHLTHLTLRWAHLPEGVWGLFDHDTQTVTIAHGLTQAERRCTIAHEIQHALRGPVPIQHREREEVAVHRAAARVLLPDIRIVGEALAWSGRCIPEAADELWVDPATLHARLSALHPSERAYLRRRLAAVEAAA